MELTVKQQDALYDVLRSVLHHSVVDVVFEKKDGTIRVMKSTLIKPMLFEHFGEEKSDDFIRGTSKTNDAIRVLETTINQFRSFRLDSVISVNGVKVQEILKLVS